jgi:3-carboxy-cis,cis-muconate cycloisomerase
VFGDEVIARVLSEEALVESWLEVERGLALAQGELGIIPAVAADAICREATLDKIDVEHLWRDTAVVGYPILPLIEQIHRNCSADVGHYIHWGATTQDIMDTAAAIQLSKALDRIENLLQRLGTEIARRAEQNTSTVMVGRTHTQHAVPITLGMKFAVWLSETARHLERLRTTRSRASTVQLFGAAGTAAALGQSSRETRRLLAEHFGLALTHVPWQSARDTTAEVAFTAAAISATCGKIAREVIELSRPEIGELQEPQAAGRGASSTMPQKQNPIGSEAIVAMSVLAIQHVPALLIAMQGTHERAAGEWQVEWDALPTVLALTGGSVLKTCEVIEGVQIFADRMLANVAREGEFVMAEKLMMALAPELGRSHAHEFVYDLCSRARVDGTSLREALDGSEVNLPELGELFAPESYLGEAAEIVTSAIETWERILAG